MAYPQCPPPLVASLTWNFNVRERFIFKLSQPLHILCKAHRQPKCLLLQVIQSKRRPTVPRGVCAQKVERNNTTAQNYSSTFMKTTPMLQKLEIKIPVLKNSR